MDSELQAEGPVRPRGLRSGDTVAVIAPASQIKEGGEQALARGIEWIRAQGWEPRPMPHSAERHGELGFLAGPDEARLADLHAAFADPEVRAVWCIRGGYGTPRLLRALDLDLIRDNPKVFVGFSDITALHLPLNQRLGLVTFHGAMIASNLGQEKWRASAWAEQSLLRCVAAGGGAPGPLSQGREEFMGQTLVPGEARGVVIGGNVALVCGLLGTPFGLDDTPGRILILEDIGEKPYQVDRMLTQLRLAMKLDQVAGVAMGQFSEMDEAQRAELAHVFRDRLGDLGKPVVTDLPFGHDNPSGCVPLGAAGRLVASKDGQGDLVFDEPVVV